jgi:anti-sigma regulatory factor (Ser/Thr protein kinase)
MRLELTVVLPHERRSVPIARHIIRAAMADLGVSSSCVYDIEVALSEACTNVVQHAGVKDQYEVRLNVDDDRCVLRVVDIGESPSRLRVPSVPPAAEVEHGRGLLLMRTLVDTVGFDSFPEQGTVVSLEKQLVYGEAAGG